MDIARAVLQWLIAYVNWTQRVPMLVAWSGGLFVLGALLFVVVQEQSQTFNEQMVALLQRSPRLQEWLASFSRPEHFQRWVFTAWSVLALVLALLGSLTRALGLTFPAASLRMRLLIAAACSAALAAAFLVVIVGNKPLFHGGLPQWSVLYLGLPLVVFLCTAYSVFVSHYLGRLWLVLA